MDELLSSFVAESREMLEEVESELLSLEQNFDHSVVDGIFRTIHTIKGNSGLFDLPVITNLAHQFETVLGKVRSGEMQIQSQMIDVFLTSVDLLGQALDSIGGGAAPDTGANIAVLQAILAGETPTPPTAATDPAPASSSGKPRAAAEAEPAPSTPTATPAAVPAPTTAPSVALLDPSVFPAELRKRVDDLEDAVVQLEAGPDQSATRTALDLVTTLYNQAAQEEWSGVREILEILYSAIALLNENRLELDTAMVDRLLVNLDRLRTLASKPGADINDLTGDWNKVPGFERRTPPAMTPGETSVAPSPAESAPVASPPAPPPAAVEQPTVTTPAKTAPAPTDPGVSETTQPTADPVATPPVPAQEKHADTHLRVPVELIDTVINLAGESVIARNDLVRQIEDTGDPKLSAGVKKISGLITRLQEGIMRTRLQHLQVIFAKVPRQIRDLERVTNKKIRLELEGGEVDLDKTLIDMISDPLMHIVRNSADHGIESPGERRAAGKPEAGLLRIHAALRGGNVVISIEDDGKGLDVERIRSRAVERGLIDEEDAGTMPPEKIYNLIFEPGFSTAEKVTTVSGRGVGMDVVRSNIQKAGGSVEVFSTPGQGTRLRLVLPQTLTIITCLILRAGGQRFALPQQNIDRLISFRKEKMARVENQMMYKLKEHFIPLFHIREIFHLGSPREERAESAGGYVIVVHSEQHHYGLLAEEILNPEEIVIKPLGGTLQDLKWYSGAAIMGDGEAILILDVPGIARELDIASRKSTEERSVETVAAQEPGASPEAIETSHILFEKNGQRFALSAAMKPRIVRMDAMQRQEVDAYEVIHHQAEIIPLMRLEEFLRFKKIQEIRHEYYAIILNHDGESVAIIADEIFNVVPGLPSLERNRVRHPLITGTTRVDGRMVVVINEERLMERWRKWQRDLQAI